MSDTDERVFSLAALPLRQPIWLDRVWLSLERPGAAAPWWRAQAADTGRAVQAAVAAGMVEAARAHVPGKGVLTFVEGDGLAARLETFARAGGGPGAAPPWGREAARRTARRAARWLLRRPAGRRVVELACRRPRHFAWLAALAPFEPIQLESEICDLLDVLAARPPRTVLEIGTAAGGTLYLLTRVARPDATLVSVDLAPRYDPALLRSFARRRQTIHLLTGDSAAPATVAAARRHLPEGVDLLFIDGDHSYEAVARDHALYAPLLQPGGLCAFHDIVEDNHTRHGIHTGGDAGGVPPYWREVKARHPHREIIADPLQDGLGIGVLFVDRPGP